VIKEISIIPENLSDVSQLNEYFRKRNDFTFKLNPKGTDFQQKYAIGNSIRKN
jgi:methylated-DNA-[protein]-cysteine S-methyltransferase